MLKINSVTIQLASNSFSKNIVGMDFWHDMNEIFIINDDSTTCNKFFKRTKRKLSKYMKRLIDSDLIKDPI